ncbi:MAG: hypothetical protein K6E47_04080 [Lachnospiraceae bacterium]|nr:hypothetical protein [Lachnospiraceae bacterium]
MILIEALALTLVIELTIALILKVRNKYDILFIALINCVTNPLINVIYTGILLFFRIEAYSLISYVVVFVLEIVVWLTEALFFKKMLEYKRMPGMLLSLILNASSFFIGLIIL